MPTTRPPTRSDRDFTTRQDETMFDARRRLRGDAVRTPLAAATERPLRAVQAKRSARSRSTIAAPPGADPLAMRNVPRPVEIGLGARGGRPYADGAGGPVGAGPAATGLNRPAPNGDVDDPLVVRHGITGRVRRGVMAARMPGPALGAPMASRVPQGPVGLAARGGERMVHPGNGGAPA